MVFVQPLTVTSVGRSSTVNGWVVDLPVCIAEPLWVAVIVVVPASPAPGVYVTVHVPPLKSAVSGENTPFFVPSLNATVPMGTLTVPAVVSSSTRTVTVTDWPMYAVVGLSSSWISAARLMIACWKLPVLPLCVLLPT